MSSTESNVKINIGKSWAAIDIIDHVEIWSYRKNTMGICSSCSCVTTTVWLHHLEKKLDQSNKRLVHAILKKS